MRCWPHAVALPAGQDPSGLLQQHGPAGLHAALRAAQGRPLADLVIDQRVARYSDQLRWAEGQLAAVRAAATVIATMPPEQVGRQIMRLAARLDMPAGEISDLVVDTVTQPRRRRRDPTRCLFDAASYFSSVRLPFSSVEAIMLLRLS